jgi:hemoglobin
MTDIANRQHIELLINAFYDKIRTDNLLGPVFNDIAGVDWEHHLPKMYSFWEFILFGADGYQGHPLRPHLELNTYFRIEPLHFERWLQLFESTVNENFAGPKATEAISRAQGIGATWSHKIAYLNKLDDDS